MCSRKQNILECCHSLLAPALSGEGLREVLVQAFNFNVRHQMTRQIDAHGDSGIFLPSLPLPLVSAKSLVGIFR